MSYEGYNQFICKNGHRFDAHENYGSQRDRCDVCQAEPAWCNSVDDTNCESDGVILDFSSFVIEPEQKETCNLGHAHVIKHARYRVPSKEEAQALRHYWDGEKHHKLDAGPRRAAWDAIEGEAEPFGELARNGRPRNESS